MTGKLYVMPRPMVERAKLEGRRDFKVLNFRANTTTAEKKGLDPLRKLLSPAVVPGFKRAA